MRPDRDVGLQRCSRVAAGRRPAPKFPSGGDRLNNAARGADGSISSSARLATTDYLFQKLNAARSHASEFSGNIGDGNGGPDSTRRAKSDARELTASSASGAKADAALESVRRALNLSPAGAPITADPLPPLPPP
jgi:hypothetical protein